ncbi:MAG: hypothetical protein JNK43_01115, partial [Ignavibacteria bacterium]|nr:hypothetical protein [Ignavibacteria bacterium]
ESEYLKLALSSSEEIFKTDNPNSPVYFEINDVSNSDISSIDLKKYNCIVLSGKSSFSQNETTKLSEYIENGGGVLVYPGVSSTPESWNNSLMKALNLPYIISQFSETTPAGFDKIDYAHPVFEGIFKKVSGETPGPESPAINSGFDLAGGMNSIAVVTMTNGKNFMVEYTKGRGRVMMFAVSPDFRNSDFPAKNLFSPITVRSVLYMANINGIRPGTAGKDYFADVIVAQNGDSIKLTSGIKDAGIRSIPVNENSQVINLNNFIQSSSVYSLTSAGVELTRFPVNFEKAESSSTRLTPKETAEYIKSTFGIEPEIIEPQETVSAAIIDIRTGRDLWQYFLAASLIFLFIEYLLARSILKTK